MQAIQYENRRQRIERYQALTAYYEEFLMVTPLSDRVRAMLRGKLAEWTMFEAV